MSNEELVKQEENIKTENAQEKNISNEKIDEKEAVVEEIIARKKTINRNKNKVRISNLSEEIKEMLQGCINCGLCKSSCPIFRLLRQEELSPRGKVILMSRGVIEKDVFKCLLCRSCEKNCPAKIKICDAIIKAREIFTLKRKEPKANRLLLKELLSQEEK